jgi:FAD/FMN-containing dehydrogenase
MTLEFSRQTFLRGAGVLGAGALLGGCRSTTSGARPTGSPASPAPQDWAALDDAIEGRVILPSDGEFATAKALFNSRFDGSRPAAVVTAISIGDVQRAVTFAARNGVKVAARAGGHSYVGDSAPADAMVIDLRQLRGAITYDGGSQLVTIPAAAELNSVQTTLNTYGRSVPAGSCPTVGVAGLTLGGGLGADTRRRGLTCDALVSATVVLPSGESVVATQDDHNDLYWALRGGGGGHFGIVTSFTFRTFPVADRDVVTLVFPEGAAAQAILGWHDWISDADPTNWSMVNVTGSDSGLRCSVVLAASAGDGPAAADDLIAAIGTSATDDTTRTLNHMALVDYFSGGEDATRPRAVVAGSDIVGEMTRDAAESIVAAASARPKGLGSATVVVESLSGAVRDVEPGGTAFPWRREAACLQWYTEPSSPETVDAAREWLTDAHETLGTHSVGGYVNYVEPDMPVARYFGGNLDRLTAIRRTYDPDAVMYSSLRY